MLAYVDEQKTQNELYFLRINLKKPGKDYPNYISNNDSDTVKQEMIKDNFQNNNCEFILNKTLSLKFSNETIAELLCILPNIFTLQSKNLNIADNIITDIKKSSLEIYENFRSLKAKWKAMQYLKFSIN